MRGAADSVALDMLTRAVAVADSSGTADQVVLGQLGHTWHLDAAALSKVDTRHAVTTTAVWPDRVAAGELSDLMDAHGPHLARTMDRSRDLSPWQPRKELPYRHIVVAVVHPCDPGRSPPFGLPRVASFARASPFAESDLTLWEAAREPLAALWALADRLERTGCDDAEGRPHPAVAGELLTQREAEVLGLLADGRLATSIASELELSPRTVHRHLANIYRKLGVHDRMIAVNLARERGLIGPSASPAIPRQRDRPSREGSLGPKSAHDVMGQPHG